MGLVKVSTRVNITFDDQLYADLKVQAKKRHRSVANLVSLLVTQGLEEKKKEEKMLKEIWETVVEKVEVK